MNQQVERHDVHWPHTGQNICVYENDVHWPHTGQNICVYENDVHWSGGKKGPHICSALSIVSLPQCNLFVHILHRLLPRLLY